MPRHVVLAVRNRPLNRFYFFGFHFFSTDCLGGVVFYSIIRVGHSHPCLPKQVRYTSPSLLITSMSVLDSVYPLLHHVHAGFNYPPRVDVGRSLPLGFRRPKPREYCKSHIARVWPINSLSSSPGASLGSRNSFTTAGVPAICPLQVDQSNFLPPQSIRCTKCTNSPSYALVQSNAGTEPIKHVRDCSSWRLVKQSKFDSCIPGALKGKNDFCMK